MIKKKTWDEFRVSGLLWFMNSILHLFGWAIVCEIGDGGKVSEVYPARCKFRGFAEECTSKGYVAVSRYLKENIEELLQEAEADERWEDWRRYMKTPECVCKTPEEYIRVALAIETLVYHDKNYLDRCLAKSDARISEEVQSLLTEALRLEALHEDNSCS